MELFEQIRRDRRAEKLSTRELADKHRVHPRTVRQALASAVAPPRKAYARRSRPAIDLWAEQIDAWLLAEVTVSRYMARRRVELGLDRVEVAVPQTHLPGAEAEVDFGEFYATVAGVWVKQWMFVMRLHEKDGVEGEIGRFRRTHLVPVPNVASLAELNVLMAAGDAADITGLRVALDRHAAPPSHRSALCARS